MSATVPSDAEFAVYRKYPQGAQVSPVDPTPDELKETETYRTRYRNTNGACFEWTGDQDAGWESEKAWELYEDPFMGNKVPRTFYSNYHLYVDTDPFNIKSKTGFNNAYTTDININEKDYYPAKKFLDQGNLNINDYQNSFTNSIKQFDYTLTKLSKELNCDIASPTDLGRLQITIDKNNLAQGLRLSIKGRKPELYFQGQPAGKCTKMSLLSNPPVFLLRKVYVVANIDPVYYELINLKWKWLNNNIKNPKFKLANWPEAKYLAASNGTGRIGTLPDNSHTYIVLPLFQPNLKNITSARIHYQDLSKTPFFDNFDLLIHPIEVLRETRAISSLTVYIYHEMINIDTEINKDLKEGIERKYFDQDGEIADGLETNTYNFISGPGKFHGFPHDQDIYNKYVNSI